MPDQPSPGALRWYRRRWFRRLATTVVVLGVPAWLGWYIMLRMPGESYQGPLPALSPHEAEVQRQLQSDLQVLAGEIGCRDLLRYGQLQKAADFIEARLTAAGHNVRRHGYNVGGHACHNLEAELKGTKKPGEIVVIGAHYDTVPDAPGADDNGSGVVGMLALARAFAGKPQERTVRFLAFVNEEPPYFQTEAMGSYVYAGECSRRGEKIVAMISLEMLGHYTSQPHSQNYPFPFSLFYPSTGNFVGFVGNVKSGELTRQAIGAFRRHAQFPSEGAAVPPFVTGVSFSDHWSFWQFNYPAIMVTDTAFFRYQHYHTPDDTIDKINFDGMARVVVGLEHVVAELARAGE
jgi:hypothetical protein